MKLILFLIISSIIQTKRLKNGEIMEYKNRKTGESFIFLAHAVNLDGLNPVSVVIFCPCDNEHSIFTMAVDQFKIQFKAVCKSCNDTGLINDVLCEYCFSDRMGQELKNAA